MSAIDCADSNNRLNLHHLWLFFFFFGYRGPNRGGDREEKKRAKRNRERRVVERERVSCKFFGLRNKYSMY